MAPKISEESKNARRSYIVQESMKLFSKKGFVETSMDDIVKATEISKGGIYTYFKSKEEIFLAIAEDRFKKRHSLVECFPKEISSKQKIIKYIQWVLNGLFDSDTVLNARFTFEFWSVVSRNKENLKVAKERYGLFYNDLALILKEGIEKGEFKKDLDVDSMVYIILSTTDGIGFCTSVMGIPVTENVVENYIDMILNKIDRGNKNDNL